MAQVPLFYFSSSIIVNMFRLAALSALVAGACAFAPTQQGASRSTALASAFENEVSLPPVQLYLLRDSKMERGRKLHRLLSIGNRMGKPKEIWLEVYLVLVNCVPLHIVLEMGGK